ncbi:hypothetical protein CTRG_01191 [Candida tropicalis MYA-3404]|uniref:Chromatin modification-related protein n=1 Tax=Candida tropicalis (strain ATCC MYA-3404 / T1) TaxID=294747 RepID=C5M5R1_CANTT|nr:hypothetical protein CTRG_01191 [Candida tropicalis MYA-3404]EER34331.1 hypothetical protein CTRG_01191 [Candida tropicalis MYA-3404]KAG4408199.1 hypothetical protein JTP64_001505 [Candida tropicalis]
MDTTTVLEKYTQDLSNVPLEVRYLLAEIKYKDSLLVEARRRYQARDNQLHKFIRTNGTLTKHPKEEQLYSKIEEDMKLCQKIQKEKIVLGNTALYLISKHLHNFENDIAKLERDDLLPPLETVVESNDGNKDAYGLLNGLSDSLSRTPTPRNGSSATPVAESVKKGHKRKLTLKGASGAVSQSSRQVKRARSEESEEPSPFEGSGGSLALNGHTDLNANGIGVENGGPNGDDADNNLYCFCQRVSFGEMIGCDNDDCKYEWFHWSCVGITSPPKDDEIWYCPDCAPKMEKRKKKRKN